MVVGYLGYFAQIGPNPHTRREGRKHALSRSGAAGGGNPRACYRQKMRKKRQGPLQGIAANPAQPWGSGNRGIIREWFAM